MPEQRLWHRPFDDEIDLRFDDEQDEQTNAEYIAANPEPDYDEADEYGI